MRATPLGVSLCAALTYCVWASDAVETGQNHTSSHIRPSPTYVVQLVSNKSEARAQTAFQELQTKYPSVLGSRQALIRRVDLGAKGIYYRAQVGPFANAEQ